MIGHSPEKFSDLLSKHMRDRGFKSDEQLARRAMMQQPVGQRRINVQRRTVNNWRNGKSVPRGIDDPQLQLVLAALQLEDAEKEMIASLLAKGSAPTSDTGEGAAPASVEQKKTKGLELRGFKIPREAIIVLAALLLIQTTYLVVTGWGTKAVRYVNEIPPTQLSLSASGFVLPESDEKIISEKTLETLTGWELYVARNEIFARHGRPFVKETSVCLQRHFDRWAVGGQIEGGWYVKRSGNPALSDVEYSNAESIRNYECGVRGGQYNCTGKLTPC